MFKKWLYEKSWKFFYTIVLSGFLFFVLITFFQKHINKGLMIVGTNFDEILQVIPVNTKEIKFTFSLPLDPDSITPQTVTIKPHLDGTIYVYDNVVVFSLTTGLVIDSEYQITFTKNIRSKEKKQLAKDYTYTLRVGPVPQVVKIFPSGSIESLHQNIIVFFSQPVVPLSSFSTSENLPCPVTITPFLSGKCKRTSTSILEFEPVPHFQGATTYKVHIGFSDNSTGSRVENITGQNFLFGNFSGTTTVTIQTPNLKAYIPGIFDPKEGIMVRFNFPVTLDNLRKKLLLSNLTGKVIPTTILPLSGSATTFYILPQGKQFGYDEVYMLNIEDGLTSRDGTDPMGSLSIQVTALPLVASYSIYKASYSTTGLLVDTKYISYDASCEGYYYRPYTMGGGGCYEPFFPVTDAFIHLHFNVPIEFPERYIRLVSQTGFQVPLEFSYVPEKHFDEKKGKEVSLLTKKIVKVRPMISLVSQELYKLVIDHNIHPHATQDVTLKLYTAPDIAIKKFRVIDYKTACVWTTVPLFDYDDSTQNRKSYITTTPQSSIAGISFVYDKDDPCYDQSAKEHNLIGHRLYLRLNPKTSYKIHFLSGLSSTYGTKLLQPISFIMQTSDVFPEDIYVGTTHKQRNIIPTGLPLVVNFQTIHVDKMDLRICTMNEEQILTYLVSSGFNSRTNCVGFFSTGINISNKGWNVASTVFDIENDVVGKPITSPFVLLQGVVSGYQKFLFKNKENLQFSSLYIRENISLTLEKGLNKYLLIATDFSGNTLEGLSFSFYKKQNNRYERSDVPVVRNKFTKVYEIIPNGQTVDFDIIFAHKPGMIGFLDLEWDATSNYEYGYVGGEGTSEKNYLYIYTDRPLYKPGDTVYFKGLLRKLMLYGYQRSNIKSGILYVFHSDSYTEVLRLPVVVDQNSNFTGMFNLPLDVKHGQYDFHFCLGGYENISDGCIEKKLYPIEHFYVEEYRKPVFKIAITSQKVQKTKEREFSKTEKNQLYELEVMVGDSGKHTVSPSYYFGGKMNNVTGFYEIYRQNYFFDAKEYVDYQFGKGYEYYNCIYWGNCLYQDYFLGERHNFYVGENGEGEFSYEFGEENTGFVQEILKYQQPKEAEKIYSFAITLQDPETTRTVTKTISTVVHTTDAYVGIKVPYRIGSKQKIPVNGVVLDWQARPLANRNVKLTLVKFEIKRVKKQGIDGVFYYDYETQETVVDEVNVFSDKRGRFTKTFTPREDGNYRILASYMGKNGHAFISASECYVAGNNVVLWNNDNNTVTEIIADAQRVKVLDTATFTVKSPVNTGFLVAIVEKDDGILDYYTQPITGYAPRVSIFVKTGYYPNFYTKIFLLGAQPNNPLPVYKRALAVTRVDTEYKKLFVTISLQKENSTTKDTFEQENIFSPRDRVRITVYVRDSNGNPVSGANGSIAIVDQSLLALKGNPKKNPFAYFFDMRRYLGVDTFIGLKRLIEKLEVKNANDGSKGGDGDMVKGGSSKKKRGIFKDTARRLANFTTDTSGMFTILTDNLPDNLTTREVEVLVNTHDGSIGINQATFLTTQPFIIDDNLPDFVGEGDQIILSPVVHNKTSKPFDLVFFITGTNIIFQKTTVDFHISASGHQKIFIPAVIQKKDSSSDQVKIEMIVREKNTLSGDTVLDALVKYVKLLPTLQTETTTTFGLVDASFFSINKKKVVTEQVNLDTASTSGYLSIFLSPNLVGQILSGIKVLSYDSYGCLEQRLTTLRGWVYTKHLYEILGSSFDFKKHFVRRWIDGDEGYKDISYDEIIKEYLMSLEKFQNPDGGFVYWQNKDFQQSSSFWLTAYVLASVGELKEAGYKISYEVIKKALSYLKSKWHEVSVCSFSSHTPCFPLEEKLFAIQALLTYDSQDYNAYKMREILSNNRYFNQENSLSVRLLKLQVIQKLLNIKKLSYYFKQNLMQEFTKIIHEIIGNEVVFTPHAAYLGKTSYWSRIQNTAVFVAILAEYGKENPILTQMVKWLVSQKKNGYWGSTQDTIMTIQALISYIRSLNLKDLDTNIAVFVNERAVGKPDIHQEVDVSGGNNIRFDYQAKNGMVGWKIPFSLLQQENHVSLQAKGKGTIYYDMTLHYYVDAKNIPSKDYGFFVKYTYYPYEAYKRILQQKYKERKKYMRGEISYNDLKYPKPIFSYLSPLTTGKVGDLVLVVVSVATTETRDKVAIDSYIPAGATLLNTNLATTQVTQTIQTDEYGDMYDGFNQESNEEDFVNEDNLSMQQKHSFFTSDSKIAGVDENFCDIAEYKLDHYFCYKDVLYPGRYTFSYVIQFTHAGIFNLLPTKAFEFYAPAVFSRTQGIQFTIHK